MTPNCQGVSRQYSEGWSSKSLLVVAVTLGSSPHLIPIGNLNTGLCCSCISQSNLKSLSILHPVEVPKALHSVKTTIILKKKTTLNHLETILQAYSLK